jgi:hypothetical protein
MEEIYHWTRGLNRVWIVPEFCKRRLGIIISLSLSSSKSSSLSSLPWEVYPYYLDSLCMPHATAVEPSLLIDNSTLKPRIYPKCANISQYFEHSARANVGYRLESEINWINWMQSSNSFLSSYSESQRISSLKYKKRSDNMQRMLQAFSFRASLQINAQLFTISSWHGHYFHRAVNVSYPFTARQSPATATNPLRYRRDYVHSWFSWWIDRMCAPADEVPRARAPATPHAYACNAGAPWEGVKGCCSSRCMACRVDHYRPLAL